MGALLCVHLSADREAPALVRVLGAAGTPVLCATLLLTFSRGAIAAGVIGLVGYLVLARTWGAATALLAAGAGSVPVLVVAWQADLLASNHPTSEAAMDQGHGLAAWALAGTIIAALVRAVLLLADRRLERLRIRRGLVATGVRPSQRS